MVLVRAPMSKESYFLEHVPTHKFFILIILYIAAVAFTSIIMLVVQYKLSYAHVHNTYVTWPA